MRLTASLLGILVGLAGLGIDLWVILPSVMSVSATNPVPLSLPEALVDFWTYFTHLTNLGLVLVYLGSLTQWRWLSWFGNPRTQALMAGYILLVMLYYHFMLAPLFHFEGPLLIATVLLHYVAPLFYLAWWAVFVPHGGLRFSAIPAMLVPGLLYVGWALARGAVTGDYPYDILDAAKNGYPTVAMGVLALLAAVTAFCAFVVSADRLARRIVAKRAPS